MSIQEQLDKILSSETFSGSSANQKLLSYLVEESLKGNVPHEADIAVDFFNKDASFNPSEDSTVRSHIYNLRNKLEKYYLTQGKHDTVRFVIPKGRYEVVFTENASHKESSKPTRKFIMMTLLTVFIMLAGLFFIVNHFFDFTQEGDSSPTKRLNEFPWSDFVSSELPTLFVIGDFFIYVHRKNEDYGNRRIRNGRVNSYSDLMDYYEQYPEEKKDFTGLTHTYVSPSVYRACMTLMPAFIKSNVTTHFKHASEVVDEDLQNNNIVFVGPLKTLLKLQPYFNRTDYDFDFYPHILSTEDDSDTTNFKVFSAEIENGLQYRKDYGFIIKTRGPSNNSIMLVTAFSSVVLPSLASILYSGQFYEKIVAEEQPPLPHMFKSLFQADIISETTIFSLMEFAAINPNL